MEIIIHILFGAGAALIGVVLGAVVAEVIIRCGKAFDK